MPSGTRAWAPTMLPTPMTAPFKTVAPMPMRHSSSTVQPCTVARCPTVTRAPILQGMPGSACTTAPSCTLVSSPTEIASVSPRMTAVGQTDARAPSATLPMTTAASWMNTSGPICGVSVPSA